MLLHRAFIHISFLIVEFLLKGFSPEGGELFRLEQGSLMLILPLSDYVLHTWGAWTWVQDIPGDTDRTSPLVGEIRWAHRQL